MQIDWFTVSVQIMNFLVLVALLKRFLYTPILRAMDTREAHIAARLQEAQDRMVTVEQQAALYEARTRELQDTRDTLLAQAHHEAREQRQQLLEEARHEVLQLQERWQHALRQEQDAFVQELRQRVGVQVCAVARQALRDLAHTGLEARVVDAFLERLQEADATLRQRFAEAVRSASQRVVVRSAFPLSTELRRRIGDAMRSHLDAEVHAQFSVQPALLCGIELEVPGYKIAWNVAEYLDQLEEHFTATLTEEYAATAADAS